MPQKTAGSNASANTNVNGSSPIEAAAAPKNTVSSIRIQEFLKNTASPTGLSEDGQGYITRMDKKFSDFNSTIRSYPINTARAEGRLIIDEASKYAVNLIYGETYAAMDSYSIAEQSKEFSRSALAARGDTKLLESIVIPKEDYVKADNMSAFLMNTITSSVKSAELTIDSLRNERFSIITRKDAVDDWIAKNSPHAIPARNDIGFLLCIDVPNGGVNRFNQPEYDQQPFMGVVGYTRILSPEDTGAGKFIPVATITDIVCKIPNQNILALALSIAADVFIVQSLWSRPYASFAQKGQPNLGNLYTDTKTQIPYAIGSMDEFHRFVNESLMRPFLAIDITEGRARPAGIDSLIYEDRRGAFVNSLSNFLQADRFGHPFDADLLNPEHSNAVVWNCRNFTGIYRENGVPKDTRYVDYLRLVPTMSTALNKIRPLLRQPLTPDGHINEVRSIFTEGVESLYTTTTVVLDSRLVVKMAQILSDANVRLAYDTPSATSISVAGLTNSQANVFTGFAQMNRVNTVNQYGSGGGFYAI